MFTRRRGLASFFGPFDVRRVTCAAAEKCACPLAQRLSYLGPRRGGIAMLTVFVVSDATGETAERMARSALVQFEDAAVQLVRRGHTATPEQVRPWSARRPAKTP